MDQEIIRKPVGNEVFCSRVFHERIIAVLRNLVAPCCQIDGVPIDSNKFDMFVDGIITGKDRSPCAVCTKDEEKGVVSYRQVGHEIWKNDHRNHLEIFYESTCDLACIYCNQQYSSKWRGELLSTPHKIPDYFDEPDFRSTTPNSQHQQFIYDEVKRVAMNTHNGVKASVTLLGGEPFLHTLNKTSLIEGIITHYYTYADSKMPWRLSIQSNGNTPQDLLERTVTSLNTFKAKYKGLEISIGMSFESTERNYEFVRYGGQWEVFKRNLYRWVDTGFHMTSQTSFNNVSLKDLTNFLKFTNEFSKKKKPLYVGIGFVALPKEVGLALLDNSFRKYVDEAMDYLESNELFMPNADELKEGVLRMYSRIGTDVNSEMAKRALRLFEYFKLQRKLDIREINVELHDYLLNLAHS